MLTDLKQILIYTAGSFKGTHVALFAVNAVSRHVDCHLLNLGGGDHPRFPSKHSEFALGFSSRKL